MGSSRHDRAITVFYPDGHLATGPRDPRFDPRCAGSSDTRHFLRNYSFLDSLRKKELDELQKAFKREKDPEKRTRIRTTINRLRNKMVENDNKSKKLESTDKLKHQYKNVRKSEIKKRLLVDKFKELKRTGKLSRYLERKRKKLINRDSKGFA